MPKVPGGLPSPDDPDAVVEFLGEIATILDGQLGHADFDKGDSGRPNGILDNFRESYVRVEITAADTAVTFSHNLDLPVVSGSVNVVWEAVCLAHSGAGTSPGPLSLEYQDGDSVGNNSIQLRLRSAGSRTIDASNPVRALVRFVPVSQW